jgi:hypothetical protein
MKLSILMPIFDETRSLEDAFYRVLQTVLPEGMEVEIVAVDDK